MTKEDDNKAIWRVVWSLIVLFILLLICSWLTKTENLSEAQSMGIFIFAFFIVFIWIIVVMVSHLRRRREEDKPGSGMEFYMRKVNEILVSRPGGEPVVWEGGSWSRYLIKTIFDINRKPHKYVGIVGLLRNANRRISLIYDADDNDIVRFFGDPSPDLLNNPFFGFRPFDSSTRAFSPFPSDYYGRNAPHVNVNLKGQYPGYGDTSNPEFAEELERLKKK